MSMNIKNMLSLKIGSCRIEAKSLLLFKRHRWRKVTVGYKEVNRKIFRESIYAVLLISREHKHNSGQPKIFDNLHWVRSS